MDELKTHCVGECGGSSDETDHKTEALPLNLEQDSNVEYSQTCDNFSTEVANTPLSNISANIPGEHTGNGNSETGAVLTPHASRDDHFVFHEKPKSWSCVCGLDGIKTALKEIVMLSLMQKNHSDQESFTNYVLLYGPWGCGKTLIASSVINSLPPELGTQLFYAHASDFVSKYYSGSNLLENLFSLAKAHQPSIIIIDDINDIDETKAWGRSFCSKLLQALDGLTKADRVAFITAATKPKGIPTALRKRIKRRFIIPLPDHQRRLGIIQELTQSGQSDFCSDHLHEIAGRTVGFSCSDLVCMFRDVHMKPVREITDATHFRPVSCPGVTEVQYTPCSENDEGARPGVFSDFTEDSLYIRKTTMLDVKKALKNCKPSISPIDLEQYKEFQHDYGYETNYEDYPRHCRNAPSLQLFARKAIQTFIGSCVYDVVWNLPVPKKIQLSLLQFD